MMPASHKTETLRKRGLLETGQQDHADYPFTGLTTIGDDALGNVEWFR
jgi:hypothetical protein